MRLFDLARLSAEAEGLRLRLIARRQVMRGAYGGLAAVFGLFALVMLHLVAYEYLLVAIGPRTAALCLWGFDLACALVFVMLALRDTPSAAEREAGMISRRARSELTSSVKTFALVAPAARIAGGGGLRTALMTAIGTQLMKRFKRRR